MAHIFIIHGSNGSPSENWFPWLKERLEHDGHLVFVPQFPVGDNQNFESWMEVFKKYESYVTNDSVFVGHSVGVSFVLSLIEKYEVSAAFLVSGFIGKIGKRFDDQTKTFAQKEFDWEKIITHCPHFVLFHGDDDPNVDIHKAYELQKILSAELDTIHGGGHLNEAAGYFQFDALYERMSEFLKNRT